MPFSTSLPVRDLGLDLANFRTVAQPTEVAAIQSMISTNPDWFWALLESLTEGYLPTENILVINEPHRTPRYTVKEGNRRVAALKIIHGHVSTDAVSVPTALESKIRDLMPSWKKENANVPCAVYSDAEIDTVDRIIALTHGKGEKAGRAPWTAVARARHNRDHNQIAEPALDLLETFLQERPNITPEQAARWAGDYHITLLAEVLQKIHRRFGVASPTALAQAYPALPDRAVLDVILRDIGLGQIKFSDVRAAGDVFGSRYHLQSATVVPSSPTPVSSSATGRAQPSGGAGPAAVSAGPAPSPAAPPPSPQAGATTVPPSGPAAVSAYDQRAVKRLLKAFRPAGTGREKLVALRDEARSLSLDSHPLAFCFLLRSMFEISAVLYCQDPLATGRPKTVDAKGRPKTLANLLKDVTNHLCHGNASMEKTLHGALAELAMPDGLLSVTSMNQLVHNPRFVTTEHHICAVFSNIFPLLDLMNK